MTWASWFCYPDSEKNSDYFVEVFSLMLVVSVNHFFGTCTCLWHFFGTCSCLSPILIGFIYEMLPYGLGRLDGVWSSCLLLLHVIWFGPWFQVSEHCYIELLLFATCTKVIAGMCGFNIFLISYLMFSQIYTCSSIESDQRMTKKEKEKKEYNHSLWTSRLWPLCGAFIRWRSYLAFRPITGRRLMPQSQAPVPPRAGGPWAFPTSAPPPV